MLATWYEGTKTEQEKESVKHDVALALRAFERLTKILEKRIKEPTVHDYNKISWPYFMADTVGYNRAMKEVLNLIKTEDN